MVAVGPGRDGNVELNLWAKYCFYSVERLGPRIATQGLAPARI